jgi:hypothetical protein
MSSLPVRADLANGDFRVLYLDWILCAQVEELDEDALEPPVPAGLDPAQLPERTTPLSSRSPETPKPPETWRLEPMQDSGLACLTSYRVKQYARF